MRKPLLCFLLLGPLAGYAQTTTAPDPAAASLIAVASPMPAAAVLPTRTDASRKLVKMKDTIQPLVGELAAFKNRPQVAHILAESTDDFLQIMGGRPTEEAYFQVLEGSLAALTPLTPGTTDRAEVAEYYEDLLDIVGITSSGGRLNAFLKRTKAKAAPAQ
ncbi:DUF4844 domain-containing protein [Hymenobacter nivis]|uniref:DUF4844 domain-containing protein n=1 Tax=Hymenobacter nivis TaxID=1850093 RepID=A0A2Z3GJG8_9BACT|nr:DUF4844 domain-containing protein [Hymenobacter nivis]AWM33963.1 hypothetical protein DDQ68_14910 [Hymenobacter nivis]